MEVVGCVEEFIPQSTGRAGGLTTFTLNFHIQATYGESACGGCRLSMPKDPPSESHPSDPSLPSLSFFERKLQPAPFLKGRSLEALTEKFDPPRLLHRDAEVERISDIIASLVRDSDPTNLFIYGKSGSGKTATVNHVLEHVRTAKNLPRPTVTLMVNCRNQVSHHALLGRLLEQLEPGVPIPINTAWGDLHERLVSACRKANANIVIVLDEVNRLVKIREECDAIYTLSNLSSELKGSETTIAIFAISNDLHYGERLDQSIHSRLQVQKMHFPPYNRHQLSEILDDRAKMVFTGDGLEPGVIDYCATVAAQTHGDARQALALLHKAAVIANKEAAHQVTMHHVLDAKVALNHDQIAEGIKGLTDHEKLILLAIARLSSRSKNNELVTTGAVLDGYRVICRELGMEPLTLQSVSRLLDDIGSQGFITSTVKSMGRGKGRTTVINITVAAGPTIDIIQEDHLFHAGE